VAILSMISYHSFFRIEKFPYINFFVFFTSFFCLIYNTNVNAAPTCKYHNHSAILSYNNTTNVIQSQTNIPTANRISNLAQTDSSNIANPTNTNDYSYQTLQIISPQNEDTIFYDNGKVTVNIQVTPTLKQSDKILLYLDNKKIQELTATNTTITLEYIERGSHQLQAQIIDQNDQILFKSPIVSFYMQQHFQQQTP
jgi:hypothetical protein